MEKIMFCPNCIEELKITERQGIEIDYCPKCRGVWLDRGELDKIIERSITTMGAAQSQAPAAAPQQAYPPPHYEAQHYHKPPKYKKSKGYKKKKKYKSLIEEIFDF